MGVREIVLKYPRTRLSPRGELEIKFDLSKMDWSEIELASLELCHGLVPNHYYLDVANNRVLKFLRANLGGDLQFVDILRDDPVHYHESDNRSDWKHMAEMEVLAWVTTEESGDLGAVPA